MAEPRSAASQPPPEDMHWAVSYLREDLQDIRNEMRRINERIDNTGRELHQRIDETSVAAASERGELRQQIEALSNRLDSYFR